MKKYQKSIKTIKFQDSSIYWPIHEKNDDYQLTISALMSVSLKSKHYHC